MVILHETFRNAGRGKGTRIPAFKKETAIIAKHPGLDQQHFGQFGGRCIHRAVPGSRRMLSR